MRFVSVSHFSKELITVQSLSDSSVCIDNEYVGGASIRSRDETNWPRACKNLLIIMKTLIMEVFRKLEPRNIKTAAEIVSK